jgi:hypothetical protein
MCFGLFFRGVSRVEENMAGSKKVSTLGLDPRLMCALSPGSLGINDAASPDTPDWFRGDTPGSLGCQDHADPKFINRVYLVEQHLRRGPKLASDPDLANVKKADLKEYIHELHGKLKSDIVWASEKVGLNPGFLASVLLSEKDAPRIYTCKKGTILNDADCVNSGCPMNSPGVCSYTVGTDTYQGERDKIERAIPASKEVKIAPLEGGVHGNEKGNTVTNLHFESGHDAILGVAVYLKYGEKMVRVHLPTFDAEPISVQWALVRLAMVPGIGDALKRIEKVKKGEDIFIHGKIVRDGHKADSAMTRVVAIGLYLSEHVFEIPVDHGALAD